MFPFESRWRWVLAPGYMHLVEAIEARLDVFHEPYRSILESRATGLRVGVRARSIVLVLLNIGIVGRIVTGIIAWVPAFGDAGGLVATVARTLTAFSLVFTVLFLLTTRYLGQLQADAVACMALGTPGTPELDAEEEERLRGIEARSQAGWLPPLPYEPREAKGQREEGKREGTEKA